MSPTSGKKEGRMQWDSYLTKLFRAQLTKSVPSLPWNFQCHPGEEKEDLLEGVMDQVCKWQASHFIS